MLKIIISKAERSVFWYDVFTVNWLYLTWYGFPLLCCVAIVAVNSILFWKGIWDEDWPLHLYQGNGKQAFFLLILLFTESPCTFQWSTFFEPNKSFLSHDSLGAVIGSKACGKMILLWLFWRIFANPWVETKVTYYPI